MVRPIRPGPAPRRSTSMLANFMKTILILLMAISLSSAETPVFSIDDLIKYEYVLDDGLVVRNAVHYQRTIGNRVWTNVGSTGINFTFSADHDGNIEFTWDNVLYSDKEPASFVVFYKNPALGLKWNPDGVEIRIDELDVKTSDAEGEVIADIYGFYKKNILVTKAWVSRNSGIVRIMRVSDGKSRLMVRRKRIG